MTAIDTSVAVAAVSTWHEAHDRCRLAAEGAVIPAHALAETYSVLTRLPAPYRLAPQDAAALLARRFGSRAILLAPATLQRGLVARLGAVGLGGGATYDGLVALTADEHGHRLLTRDRRAMSTYDALGVAVDVLD